MSAQRPSGFVPKTPGSVLIVEDDLSVSRAVQRHVPKGIDTILVYSIAEARGALATSPRLAAAVVDIGLPDGSGLEIVRLIRQRSLYVPVLVLTGLLDGQLINETNALGAQYVVKPDFSRNLVGFFHTLTPGNPEASEAVARLAPRFRLTNREQEILIHAMSGVPRGRIAEVLGISENTLKKYIRSLLKKTSQSSLSEAIWFVRTAVANAGDAAG